MCVCVVFFVLFFILYVVLPQSGVTMCKNESGRGSCSEEDTTEAATAAITRQEPEPTAPSGRESKHNNVFSLGWDGKI